MLNHFSGRITWTLFVSLAISGPAILKAESVKLSNGMVAVPTLRQPITMGPVLQQGSVTTLASGLPHFVLNLSFFGTILPTAFVGGEPSTGAGTTTIPTTIIPIRVVFQDGSGSLDPTSNLPVVLQSPVFTPVSFDGIAPGLGFTQYGDAGQRAQFWFNTQPGGIAPNYHLLLGSPNVRSTVTINIPAGSGTLTTTASGKKLGVVDEFFWSLSILFALLGSGVTPDQLPILLTSDVALSNGNSCCVLGFHASGFGPAATNQTWLWASWLSPGIFSTFQDSVGLSHEVSEWINDPFVGAIFGQTPGINWVGPYVLPGQNGACQFNFETGDVVEALPNGTFSIRAANGFTYHLQDIAFIWYFLHTIPSPAIGGRYTLNGIFPQPATFCGQG